MKAYEIMDSIRSLLSSIYEDTLNQSSKGPYLIENPITKPPNLPPIKYNLEAIENPDGLVKLVE